MMVRGLIAAALLLGGCAPAPEMDSAPAPPPPAENIVYLYARLHEIQTKDTAEDQYLPNLTKALADYEASISIEEIRGAEGGVEYIGVDFKITAPKSETESLESHLMDTFRLSGAPYATQILVYEP